MMAVITRHFGWICGGAYCMTWNKNVNIYKQPLLLFKNWQYFVCSFS